MVRFSRVAAHAVPLTVGALLLTTGVSAAQPSTVDAATADEMRVQRRKACLRRCYHRSSQSSGELLCTVMRPIGSGRGNGSKCAVVY